ncbi:MAG: YlbF family regulator [Lachnospiraceae bacterium]|jgi:cell fate (sporulation/competence/biofilm development) regulator YlbF (YheA/YmcA/DUF963 family)|nr:YlbF family regulator [Lachnospiraceae bacterium]
MDANVEKKNEELIRAILDSESYKEYRRQLDRVLEDPILKAQIDDYRQRNFELTMADETDLVRISQFQQEFKDFRQDPLVDDFLAAELDFCRMMQVIETRLIDALDFQ